MGNKLSNKFLIAGGAGFIGCNLVQFLLTKGAEITVIDNLYTGMAETLEQVGLDKKNLIVHDVIEPLHLDGADYDYIINLASPASPPAYQKDPIFTLKTNIMGTTNLLEIADKQQAVFLQASTSEIYGDPKIHPQREEYWGNVNPVGMRSCYDEGKRVSEALCYEYYRQRGVDARIIRIFNTYGPLMDPEDGRVVSNFVMQALKGDALTVQGDGNQTRSLCFVDDLVAGIWVVLNRGGFGPVNLGNPHEITMLELAEIIIRLTGSSSKIIHNKLPADDPTRRCPDISKAKALGWSPQIGLEEGLIQTIEYYIAKTL